MAPSASTAPRRGAADAAAGASRAADGDDDAGAQQTLAEWLAAAPFTLAMSSSFFGFYAHAGALQALEEAGLRPARVCGSSSGSIIATLYAGGLEPARELRQLLLSLRREDILTPFWAGAPGAGLYRINQAFLQQAAPAARLEHGRLPVAVSTFDVASRRTVSWTSGATHEVVAASCAIPGVMQPVRVEGRVHVDGGVGDLLGLASCAPDERVLSIDLHTIGLTRMRAVHVALLGTRPGTGAAARLAPGAWQSRLWRRGGRSDGDADVAVPEQAVPPATAVEPAVPPSSPHQVLHPPPLLRHCARLQLHGLPFVGPRSMESGEAAMDAGAAAMRAALATRAHWGGERVVAVPVPKAQPDATPMPVLA